MRWKHASKTPHAQLKSILESYKKELVQNKVVQNKKLSRDSHKQSLIDIDILIKYTTEGSPVDGIEGHFLPDEHEKKLLEWYTDTEGNKDLRKTFKLNGTEKMGLLVFTGIDMKSRISILECRDRPNAVAVNGEYDQDTYFTTASLKSPNRAGRE